LNLPYLIPRVIRHFLPERIVRFLLLRSLVIEPGLETRDPQAAVQRYADILAERGDSLKGKRVMVFGYGGRFDLGVGLLEAGADSVVLCEKFAPPDDAHNRQLLPRFETHLRLDGELVRPRSDRITLSEADIREVRPTVLPSVDLVISNSVYEHLDDVEGITRSLAALTRPGGLHIHFVDLRDHFFKYPFEMLTYSKPVWYGWLNPSSNHNRYRLWDYRRVFEAFFSNVEIAVLARDEVNFAKARARIRPEFLSGNVDDDAVTLIRVLASQPRAS
jgi:SAM-dependent methyltransferase